MLISHKGTEMRKAFMEEEKEEVEEEEEEDSDTEYSNQCGCHG